MTTVPVDRGSLLAPESTSRRMRNLAATVLVYAAFAVALLPLITAAISVPVAIGTAVYLVEYGRGGLARAVSFAVDVLTGVPSIVAALFIYAVWVGVFGLQRVALAGSLAL